MKMSMRDQSRQPSTRYARSTTSSIVADEKSSADIATTPAAGGAAIGRMGIWRDENPASTFGARDVQGPNGFAPMSAAITITGSETRVRTWCAPNFFDTASATMIGAPATAGGSTARCGSGTGPAQPPGATPGGSADWTAGQAQHHSGNKNTLLLQLPSPQPNVTIPVIELFLK